MSDIAVRPGDRRSRPSAGDVAARMTWFFVFWLLIAGRDLAGLPVGLAAAALAAWASLRLLPRGTSRVDPAATLALALRFARQSALCGFDVARRALDPRLSVNPGFATFPLTIEPGGARCAFCVLSSLLPGSLPAGESSDGRLIVHCLDVDQPTLAGMATEEALFTRAFGLMAQPRDPA